MHAYLLIGQNSKVKTQSRELAKKLKAKAWEFPLIKIEDARELGKFTALKLTEPTAIVINSIDAATEEAQNAFLKNLEEPQQNLYYILTADSLIKVLPTIISRCQIIKMPNAKCQMLNENSKLNNFLKLTVGEKLAFVDQIKDRGEAKALVLDLITFLHQTLIKAENKTETAKNLKISVKTLNHLEANGNVNLQLTNLAINLYN
jgi:DNA polymerase III gamma/tau subunit